MDLSRGLLILLRAGAAIQVIVGIGLWTGHWSGLTGAHRTIGVLFVLTFWAIAGIAILKKRLLGLATGALAWGALVAALGFTQQRLLPGDSHWVVRLAHLVIALACMPMAERLAAKESASVGAAG